MKTVAARSNSLCFPNLMSDAECKQCPRLVGYSCEFDCYLRCALDQRDLFERNGRLLDFGVLKGTFHGSFWMFHLAATNEWFDAFARVCNAYL